MKQTHISKFQDEEEFYKGTRFRQYGVGLNVPKEEDDFYEYMLSEVPDEESFMLLICVEGHQSGSALAFVETEKTGGRHIAKASAIKFSMGEEKVYLLER